MISKARGRFILVTARKIRLMARLLKGLDVPQAAALLRHMPKRGACEPISKVFKSAVANATRTGAWREDQLFVSTIVADGGPSLKRHRAGSMGKAAPYKRRMCHITIELDARAGNGS